VFLAIRLSKASAVVLSSFGRRQGYGPTGWRDEQRQPMIGIRRRDWGFLLHKVTADRMADKEAGKRRQWGDQWIGS
jgi:hypothetical protein